MQKWTTVVERKFYYFKNLFPGRGHAAKNQEVTTLSGTFPTGILLTVFCTYPKRRSLYD